MAERHWSECSHERGIFAKMMAGLVAEHGEKKTVMIDDEAGGATGSSRRPNDLKARDLPLSFHPAVTGARLVFTPVGAGLAIARRAELSSCAAGWAIAVVRVRASSAGV